LDTRPLAVRIVAEEEMIAEEIVEVAVETTVLPPTAAGPIQLHPLQPRQPSETWITSMKTSGRKTLIQTSGAQGLPYRRPLGVYLAKITNLASRTLWQSKTAIQRMR
jgi:hypothetical protein